VSRAAASADVFTAIADPTRRRLLDLLSADERPVRALADEFAVSRPAISQHLRVLLDAGLVSAHRTGREVVYRLEAAPLAEAAGWLGRYERFWAKRLRRLGDYLDRDE
jgi:DNA-binding transcriptional ArsR family regulator